MANYPAVLSHAALASHLLCAKYRRYLSDILRIKNILLFQPASSGDINSVACMSYLTHAVGIRIDDQCHPERLGAFCLQPIDVESLGWALISIMVPCFAAAWKTASRATF